MSYFAELAGGLRSAAGVLNPNIQKNLMEQEQLDRARQDQQAQLLFAQLAKQVESGGITADQAAQAAKARGINVDAGLFGGPSLQAQAAQETLANERGFRSEVMNAGGDMAKIASAAVKFGKPEVAVNIYKAQEDRQARREQQAAALEQRQRELEARMEDRAATREQQAQYQQMMAQIRRDSLALQSEIARGSQELKRLQIEMMGDRRKTEQEKADEKVTQQLGTALEKANIPQTAQVLRAAEKAASDDKVIEYLTGPKSLVPDMVAGNDVTNARQAIQKLFNITLKDRSGAAVTNQELERLKAEFGSGVFKTSQQLRDAITQAKSIIDAHYKGIAAGFGKGALDRYNANLKEMGGDPLDFGSSGASGGWGIREIK